MLAAWVAVLALLAGCGGNGEELAGPPDREPEYAGVVEDVDEAGRVLVRAPGDACGIWTAPEPDVRVYRRDEGGFAPATWDELRPGRAVELWIPGPIAESCPMQGAAEAAVLVDERV